MEFFDLLVRYEVGLWDFVDEALRREGCVSAAALQGLTIVGDRGGTARVLDVSTEIGITVGAASKFVDRLERNGLVERRPNPDDRRSSLLVLTDLGVKERAAAARVRAAVLRDVLEPAAARNAEDALVTLLERLYAARQGVRA